MTPALSTDAVKVITYYFMLCSIAQRNIDSCKVDLSTQVTYGQSVIIIIHFIVSENRYTILSARVDS